MRGEHQEHPHVRNKWEPLDLGEEGKGRLEVHFSSGVGLRFPLLREGLHAKKNPFCTISFFGGGGLVYQECFCLNIL